MSRSRFMILLVAGVFTVCFALIARAQSEEPSNHPIRVNFEIYYEQVEPVNGKGGSGLSGPYSPVRGWPEPPVEGRMLADVPSVFVVSPDRVIVASRTTRDPWPIPYTWDARSIYHILAADRQDFIRRQSPDHKITVYNRDGKMIEYWKQWDDLFTGLQFVRVSPYDAEGHVYVTGGGEIKKFSRDGKELVYVIKREEVPTGPGQTPFLPEGTTFLPDGSFWVVSFDRVIRFSEHGEYLEEFGRRGSGPGELHGAHDVFFDKVGGRIYVADRNNHRIQIFDEDGGYLDQWPNIVAPAEVRMTADRQFVWVADIFTAKFLKFDLEGRLQTSWGTWGFAPGAITGGIHDFTTDEEGNLYIADHSNDVQKWRPSGHGDPEQLIGRLLPY